MSWSRKQFERVERFRKPLGHVRVPLQGVQCADCRCSLAPTYPLARFLDRCRRCYALYAAQAVPVALVEGGSHG